MLFHGIFLRVLHTLAKIGTSVCRATNPVFNYWAQHPTAASNLCLTATTLLCGVLLLPGVWQPVHATSPQHAGSLHLAPASASARLSSSTVRPRTWQRSLPNVLAQTTQVGPGLLGNWCCRLSSLCWCCLLQLE